MTKRETSQDEGGYFLPVRALITKALGEAVWENAAFLTVWEAYKNRRWDLEQEPMLGFSTDFEAGLVVGMWASGAALTTIRTQPWVPRARDDGEQPFERVLAKVRPKGKRIPTPDQLEQALEGAGPSQAAYNLVLGCESARYLIEVKDSAIRIIDPKSEANAFLAKANPEDQCLDFVFAESDPRVPYIERYYSLETKRDGQAVFSVHPSSMVGRFVRTVCSAAYEVEWDWKKVELLGKERR